MDLSNIIAVLDSLIIVLYCINMLTSGTEGKEYWKRGEGTYLISRGVAESPRNFQNMQRPTAVPHRQHQLLG